MTSDYSAAANTSIHYVTLHESSLQALVAMSVGQRAEVRCPIAKKEAVLKVYAERLLRQPYLYD